MHNKWFACMAINWITLKKSEKPRRESDGGGGQGAVFASFPHHAVDIKRHEESGGWTGLALWMPVAPIFPFGPTLGVFVVVLGAHKEATRESSEAALSPRFGSCMESMWA